METKEEILQALAEELQSLLPDWDCDLENSLTAETRLGADLDLDSIKIVQLIMGLEKRYGRANLPFQDLFSSKAATGTDISVGDFVEFLHFHLAN